jgi:hypothetical protein
MFTRRIALGAKAVARVVEAEDQQAGSPGCVDEPPVQVRAADRLARLGVVFEHGTTAGEGLLVHTDQPPTFYRQRRYYNDAVLSALAA